MGFYYEWGQNMGTTKESHYIYKFLRSDAESISPLLSGSMEEQEGIYKILTSTPIESFFECLMKMTSELPSLNSSQIPCFSNMEKGASRLNELLLFSKNGLTFEQIGYQLIKAKSNCAKIKYGENQAKLALMMSLVSFDKKRPIVVYPTAWGTYLTRFSFEEKKNVLKKLLLRNPCIQHILFLAFHGVVSYQKVVSFLSKTSIVRRRTSVKYLITFILNDTERKDILKNIEWKIEVD